MSILGWYLLGITLLLVVLGAFYYEQDQVGWAQFLWVTASGTAGAWVLELFDSRKK